MCRKTRRRLTYALLFAVALAGCECGDDAGRCCTALDEEARARIPKPIPVPNGIPRDNIGRDPKFDCSGLTCASREGSEPFCTRACDDEDTCDEGFSCLPLLGSSFCDPDKRTEPVEDDCQPGDILPTDTFCVRKDCSSGSCPEDFTCVEIQPAMGSTTRRIAQCVKAEHMCPSGGAS